MSYVERPQVSKVVAPRTVDRDIARIARKQHGLITTRQLKLGGLTSGAITKRVRSGRLFGVHRGVYAVGHVALSFEGRCHAAVLAAGEGALLGHLAAASLWQIWRRQVPGIDVVIPRQRAPSRGSCCTSPARCELAMLAGATGFR